MNTESQGGIFEGSKLSGLSGRHWIQGPDHHILYKAGGYVLPAYRQDTGNKEVAVQRRYFYNKEEAFGSFVSRSGLVTVGRLTDRFEDILPELYKADRTFDISRLFGSWGRGQRQEDKQILGKGSFPVHQVNHVDKCLHLFVIKLACSPQ